MKNQPEHTKITTSHTINYKGYKATIKGEHILLFAKNGSMQFTVIMKTEGCYSNHTYTIGARNKPKTKLKYILDALIQDCEKDKRDYAERRAFEELKKSAVTVFDKISHTNFLYARLQNSAYGNYYNLYWKDDTSPTGVSLVGVCSEEEWELISKETNNSHNYLSQTEGRR